MHLNSVHLRRSPFGRRALVAVALVVSFLTLCGSARAQELYTYSVGVLGGVGGSPDDRELDGYDQGSLQLDLSFATDSRTLVGLRYGQLDLGPNGHAIGQLVEPELRYLTIGGEYRTRQSYYDSGLFAAIGAYRLEGSGAESETAVGLSVGATGEFPINRRFGVVAEIAGHYADLDEIQLFLTAHAGLVFHF